MDIYQESYQKIQTILAKEKGKTDDADLDMYADDFDQKEKQTLGGNQTEGETKQEEEETNPNDVKWEFKWSQEDSAEISGPHSTEQMHKWMTEGHFKTGVWVRKHGDDSQFYSSNRMDFELYMQLYNLYKGLFINLRKIKHWSG